MFLKSLPPPPPGVQLQTPPKLPPQFTEPGMKIWFFIPVPYIEPINQLGAEPEGLASQKIIHDKFIDWHEVSSYLMMFLLLLHILAALKHQFLDKHAELHRMGIGRSRVKH
jgi:cytochrome b561